MATELNIVEPEPQSDDVGFSLGETSNGVEIDELSKDAMGGTEMMKYGLYDRLPSDIKDEVQIICSRVRKVDADRPSILWLHDLFNDPEAVHLREEESRNRFAKLVFVSHWQFNTYHLAMGIPHSQSVVLKNAIEPITDIKKPNDGTIRMIYHTTPHRGLELLIPVVEWLEKFNTNFHLDVYSSFEAYGWPQRDEPYKQIFQKIIDSPNMTYHGYKPNDVVREALKEAHIFAYPCIWQETSCIAAMEAMSAGCAIVCPEYAALPETTANFALTYPWHEDIQEHANVFANALSASIDMIQSKPESLQPRLNAQKMFADSFYSWDQRAREWENLIRGIIATKA